jgi:multidrug efflux system outer membrane protein
MSANATLELVKAQVQNQRDLLELVDLGFQKGAARSTDVLQQRQQLAASEARVPAALQGKKFAEEGLRRLLGTAPGNVGAVFPTIAAAPAAGSAAELLKARPDLKAAAHNWDAARLKRISAQRAYGPSLSLNGQVGWQYYQFEEFDSIQTWGAGATANVPVFSGGRIASGVRAAKANEQIANHSLRGSTLTVLQELRTSTVADTAAEETLAAITRQQEAAKAAFDEAKAQYQRGVISYIQVLPILIASQVADLSAIEAQRQRVNARIQLHDTIGGTWPNQLTSDGVTP